MSTPEMVRSSMLYVNWKASIRISNISNYILWVLAIQVWQAMRELTSWLMGLFPWIHPLCGCVE